MRCRHCRQPIKATGTWSDVDGGIMYAEDDGRRGFRSEQLTCLSSPTTCHEPEEGTDV